MDTSSNYLDITKKMKETLSSQLTDLMELSNLTRSDLSKITGCKYQWIYSWTTGQSLPKTGAAIALARALGVSVELLMTGEEV